MLPRAVFEKSKLWPNGSTIHVSFYQFTSLDTPDINLNAYIAKTITEKIAPYVNLSFVFDIVNDSNAGDIQIGYSSDTNTHLMSIYGNKLGTNSLYTKDRPGVVSLYLYKPAIAPSGTTFTYNGQTYTTPTFDQSGFPSGYIGMSILRNFCMALGMVNEIRNPVGVSLTFDINAIVSSFVQQYPTSSVTEAQLRYFYEPYLRSQVVGSSYDTNSIMNYTTSPTTFLIQLSSYNTALSGCDKSWLMSVYPKSSYSLPNGETKYSLQQSCAQLSSASIGGFEWVSPSLLSDEYQLQKAGAVIASFAQNGILSVPTVKLSQPPVASAQGSFLSLNEDGSVGVDSSIQSFKQDLVGVVNQAINKVNELQANQLNVLNTLSGTVQDNQSFVTNKLVSYEEGMGSFSSLAQQTLADHNTRLVDTEQKTTTNRTHIDDLYLTQSTDRTNLSRYIDDKSKIVQDDLDLKSGLLGNRVTIVENVLPGMQSHLGTLTDDMKEWSGLQMTTQQLQTQLISNLSDISNRFDAFESLESRFAQDVLDLKSRVQYTLDSFQSIQTVITQNYNNLASRVLPTFGQIEVLKQDVHFLKTSSYVLIAILAVILVALFLYVFVGKIRSKEVATA